MLSGLFLFHADNVWSPLRSIPGAFRYERQGDGERDRRYREQNIRRDGKTDSIVALMYQTDHAYRTVGANHCIVCQFDDLRAHFHLWSIIHRLWVYEQTVSRDRKTKQQDPSHILETLSIQPARYRSLVKVFPGMPAPDTKYRA